MNRRHDNANVECHLGHQRSGDPIALSAYLGEDDEFPEAIAAWSEGYADQNERDHADLLKAIRTGRLASEPGV